MAIATLTPAVTPSFAVAPAPPVTVRYRVETVSHLAALVAIEGKWSDLASAAMEPNPFFSPDFLLPEMALANPHVEFKVLLAWSQRSGQRDELVGLFPLTRDRNFALPGVQSWRLWRHRYGSLCTPLLHREHATALTAIGQALQAMPGLPLLMSWPHMNGVGPLANAFEMWLRSQSIPHVLWHRFDRALLVPNRDSQTYLANSLSAHTRQEMRRLERRLAEHGPVAARPMPATPETIEQFLVLENQSWKGHAGTSLLQDATNGDFFREMARRFALRGQLQFYGLFLNDLPIAMKVNLYSQHGGFTFKIAYDPRYARYSPGTQLEVCHVHEAHRQPGLSWLDSCATAGHPMIERLWSERRPIQHWLTATPSWCGRLLLKTLGTLRQGKRGLLQWRGTSKVFE